MSGDANTDSTMGSLLRKGTLGWRILSWFLALSLLPLLLTNSVGYAVSLRVLEDRVEGFLRSLAESQANHVALQASLHELKLAGYAGSHVEFPMLIRAAVGGDSGVHDSQTAVVALTNTLRHELRESVVFDEFLILAPDATWILSTGESSLPDDWFDPWAAGKQWDRPFTSEAWEVGGQVPPVLTAVYPVTDDRGLAGLFVGTVHAANLQRYLGIPEHFAGYVESYLVADSGRPLFVSHSHRPIDFGVPLQSALLGDSAGVVRVYDNYEGESVVATSADVPGIGWRYIVEAPREAVLGDMQRLRMLSAVFGTAFALLLVALVWIVTRSLVSPLQELVGAAERLRVRELGVQVAVNRSDEIGQLGHTFNQMSRELERSQNEIQELHELELSRAAQFATVGELAAGIAHEIKNPVAGITSGVELLANRSQNDAEAQDLLSQIQVHLAQIEASVNDLLSYARPRSPDIVTVDPTHIVDEALSLLAAQAEARAITIRRVVDPDIPSITADPTQITHAVLNLALNAIQAMPDGGTLTVHAGHDADNVFIAVSDTGIGIGPEVLQQIFRPFYTTKHRGSGLGLAITRGIVERHGGRLEVESALGIGSEFALVLPTRSDEEVE